MSSNHAQVRREAQESNTWLLWMYEVRNLQPFKNKVSVPGWQMAGRHREGDMHYCHAPCRLQSWGWNKDRGTHVSVYFYNYCCSEHSHSKKKQYFQDKGFQFSKRSRHTQKTNNKNLHTCSLLHSLNFPYCALLFMKGCSVKHNGARVNSHHCSTRPEKQSWKLSTATFTFLPHLKMLTYLYCISPSNSNTEKQEGLENAYAWKT